MPRQPKKNSSADKRKATRDKRRSQDRVRGASHPPDERIDKAQQAWADRRYDDAVRLYERALERAPTNAVLLVDVARAYALRFRHADAERLIERASRLHPDDARLQRMLGRSFVQLQQYDRAIACFHRSLELEPDSPERARTLYELAHMYERLHRLDDARAAAEQSLALAPHQYVLRYLLGVIDRRSGNLQAARVRLEELVTAGEGPPEVLADASYQLGAIHDKEGRYGEAITWVRGAKQILNNIAGPLKYDAADIADAARRTYRSITQEHFDRWHAAGSRFRPLSGGLALLASHPRSGTTLLEQALDSHPGIVSADEIQAMTEVVCTPLFQDAAANTPAPQMLDGASPDEIDARRHDYWMAMQGSVREPISGRVLLDKNPALTGLLPVIARVFPEMKFLFALRDPRDVVLSCYLQQLPLNTVSVHYLSLEETARQYAAIMRLWLKVRNMIRNPWIEVRYEDTVRDIGSQARRVLEFLGLPWSDSVLDYRTHAQQKHVHSPTYEAVTKPIYTSSIGRWRNYAEQLEPCLDTLRPYVEAFGYA